MKARLFLLFLLCIPVLAVAQKGFRDLRLKPDGTLADGPADLAPGQLLIDGVAVVPGGLTDGNRGDVTISDSGATVTLNNNVVSLNKLQNISSGTLLGRFNAGTGDVEVINTTALPISIATQAALDTKLSSAPTGRTIWVDADNGSDATGLRGRRDKPFATILAAAGASGITSGDLIEVGPGIFTFAGTVFTLPIGVSLKGSGADATIIQNAATPSTLQIKLTPGAEISRCTINGYVGMFAPAGGSGVLREVKVNGEYDAIFIIGTVGQTTLVRVYDSVLTSSYDTVNAQTAGTTLELYNCVSIVNPNPLLGISRGISCKTATVRWFGGQVNVNGAGNSDRTVGFEVTSGTLEVFNTRLTISGAGALYDASNTDSGTLRLSNVSKSDGSAFVTNGAVTQLSRSASRDNNLSDLTDPAAAIGNLGAASATDVNLQGERLTELESTPKARSYINHTSETVTEPAGVLTVTRGSSINTTCSGDLTGIAFTGSVDPSDPTTDVLLTVTNAPFTLSIPTSTRFNESASTTSVTFTSNGLYGLSWKRVGSVDALEDNAGALITTVDIADNAVTTPKIPDSNITTSKVAPGAITTSKLDTTGVTAGTYTAGNVTVNEQGRVTSASSNTLVDYTTPASESVLTVNASNTPNTHPLSAFMASLLNNADAGAVRSTLAIPSGVNTGDDGWVTTSDTWTYASATSFTVTGVDRTSIFTIGDRLKLTQSGVKYFYVTAVAFSTDTTVTVTGGTDYSLSNAAITSPRFSHQANPNGFPQWFSYTPTWTGFSTAPSGGTAKFSMLGGLARVYVAQTTDGTSNSTATTVSLPVAASFAILHSDGSRIKDNSAVALTPGRVDVSGSTATVYPNTGGQNWTASGSKNAYFFIGYPY